VSAWVAAILLINEVPDVEADRRALKRTLVVRWGAAVARWIYCGLTMIALAASAAAIVHRTLPLWYAVPAVILGGLGLKAARGIASDGHNRPRLKRSIEMTLAIHTCGCIAMILAIWLRPAL
jgi:1,4-dihydroxy-2-naphthoate octaprenyltransferase